MREDQFSPGQQAGCPVLRAGATADAIYPYEMRVGYHDPMRVPMTAAGMRSLRDALDALLAGSPAPEAEDFVAEWAQAHGAVVHDSPVEAPAPPAESRKNYSPAA